MRERVAAYELEAVPLIPMTRSTVRGVVGSSRPLDGASVTRQRERPHRLLLWLVTLSTAGSGLLNIYSVIGDSLPERMSALARFIPLEFQYLSRFLTLLTGFALVVSSINIYKRKQRALRLVLILAPLSVLFHLTKGIDYEEASTSLLLLVILLLTRKRFNVRSGPPDLSLAALRATAGMLILFCYGVAGFWLLEEGEFGINFHVADALKRTLLMISLVGDPQLTPQTLYARWFTDSVYLLTFAAIIYVGLAFFRPVVYRLRTLPQERFQASAILREHGRSALDFFKLWPDKSYYFNEQGSCFIAYRVRKNYAMALADPVGPEKDLEETMRGFLELCRSNDWGVAFHQTLPDFLAVYSKLGFKHLKIGDEAVVNLTTFSLGGRRRKKLRSNVQKFESGGYRIIEYQPPIPDEILREAERVSDDWLSLPGRRERQFSLGRFEKAYVRTTPLYILVDARGSTVAFVNRIESYRRGEATIDLMRHLREAPNGTMDYLFTKLFLDCKEKGFQQFSLGMAPLDGFHEGEQPTPEERAVYYFMHRLNFIFSYSGLRHYKAKFADAWEPRYLIYQNILTLPQVALALAKVSEIRVAKGELKS
jgi:phosphatidylglycerol lysyltransferase